MEIWYLPSSPPLMMELRSSGQLSEILLNDRKLYCIISPFLTYQSFFLTSKKSKLWILMHDRPPTTAFLLTPAVAIFAWTHLLRDYSFATKKKCWVWVVTDTSAAICMLLASEKNNFPIKPLSHSHNLTKQNKLSSIPTIFIPKWRSFHSLDKNAIIIDITYQIA